MRMLGLGIISIVAVRDVSRREGTSDNRLQIWYSQFMISINIHERASRDIGACCVSRKPASCPLSLQSSLRFS
jgi:hypothetical protein